MPSCKQFPNRPTIPQSGLTLIELSIVIVGIGLLVGGVLVGKDLIDAANMRSQLSQIDKLNTAVLNFKVTYSCLPGDCSRATQFFPSTTQPEQVTNGNGNNRIDGMLHQASGGTLDGGLNYWTYATGVGREHQRVFDHLSAAGLIDEPQYDETVEANIEQGIAFPLMKFSSRLSQRHDFFSQGIARGGGVLLGWQLNDLDNPHIPEGHWFRLSMRQYTFVSQKQLSAQPGFQPWDAKSLDEKIDDGKPMTGKVTLGFDYHALGTNIYCADLAANSYLTPTTLVSAWTGTMNTPVGRACRVAVRAVF